MNSQEHNLTGQRPQRKTTKREIDKLTYLAKLRSLQMSSVDGKVLPFKSALSAPPPCNLSACPGDMRSHASGHLPILVHCGNVSIRISYGSFPIEKAGKLWTWSKAEITLPPCSSQLRPKPEYQNTDLRIVL